MKPQSTISYASIPLHLKVWILRVCCSLSVYTKTRHRLSYPLSRFFSLFRWLVITKMNCFASPRSTPSMISSLRLQWNRNSLKHTSTLLKCPGVWTSGTVPTPNGSTHWSCQTKSPLQSTRKRSSSSMHRLSFLAQSKRTPLSAVKTPSPSSTSHPTNHLTSGIRTLSIVW